MTTLKVGIANYEGMKARSMAVAWGERRVKADEPKVWFRFAACGLGRLSPARRRLAQRSRFKDEHETPPSSSMCRKGE